MARWMVGLVMLVSAPALAAQALSAPRAVSVHSSWGAFRDGERCYAIAMAEPTPYTRERQPFASVSVAPGAERFTMRLSRTIARGAIITLDVGNRRFRLDGGGDSAWGKDGGKDQMAGNKAIIAAMRSRDTMTVGARDAQGRLFRDAYRLRGAPTAIDAATIACR